MLVFGLPAEGSATNPKPCPDKSKKVHGVCKPKPAKPSAPATTTTSTPAPAKERFAVRVTASQVSTVYGNLKFDPGCQYRLSASFSVPSTTTITATLGADGLTFAPQAAEGDRAIPFEVTAGVTYSGCAPPRAPCGPATTLIFPGLFELAADQGKLKLDYASIHRVFPGDEGGCSSGIMETEGMTTPFDPKTLLKNSVTTVSGTWSRVQNSPVTDTFLGYAETTTVDFQVRFTRLP